MTSEKIKNLVKGVEKRPARGMSTTKLMERLRENIALIKKCADLADNSTIPGRWLAENFSFLKTCISGIDFRCFFTTEQTLQVVKCLFSCEDFEGSKEDIHAFFVSLTAEKEVTEKELNSLKSVFLIVLAEEIRLSAEGDEKNIPRLFTLLHNFMNVDFESFAIGFSPLEQYLRYDPAGIYPNMTRATQALYKERIKKEARRKNKTSEKLCREKLESAKKQGVHIGKFLEENKRCRIYFPILVLFFLILLWEFSWTIRKPVLVLLLAVPLYFFCKRLVDFVFSLLRKKEVLPQLKVDVVSENEKTTAVIASLITSKKDIDLLCQKIQRFQVNNFEKGDRIFFGLLCDLPEKTKETVPEDAELFDYLNQKISEMNQNKEVFFAFLRRRCYHKSENSFVGWERKRGAIEQLISFLGGQPLDKQVEMFGVGDQIVGSRYLITLDGDTELGIGQAKRLIGFAAHPLNQPVIGIRRGKKVVISGHGIIQPKITSSLLEKITTPFGKIYGNGSGEIFYASASYDTMQSLFGEGNFCGKGIIHVGAYNEVMHDFLPEQKILSHDMPEGAMLRCGLATNEYFADSSPQSTISHYKRLHRWIRGDVQNLSIIFKIPPRRAWFAIENVLSYLTPICELLFLFVSGFYGRLTAGICALLVLLFHCEGTLITGTGFLLSGNWEHFNRRFSTRMRNLILNSFYQGFLSLSAIAFETVYFLDAVFRSLYRMTVSKKRLLQWQVYSPLSRGKDPFLFFLPSILLTTGFLFFCRSLVAFLYAILWLLFPFLSLFLSLPYKKVKRWSKKEKEYLTDLAAKEFRFFQECVGEKTNFLPPDNIQLDPLEKIAMRTSPTNIGLYLASLIAAWDFGLLNAGELCRSLKKTLEVTKRLERYGGHLYNWYDLNTLNVIGERFISTVDSGNYIASLITVYQALEDLEKKDSSAREVRQMIKAEIDGANFALLYDYDRNLFRVGLVPDDNRKGGPDYDLYMSEARITSFLAISLGQIGPGHWFRLSRPLLSYSGRVGLGSWTGTAFEYFMPPLFLPVIENSLEDESLDFALFCQKKFNAHCTAEKPIFGISESGYSLTDAQGNFQYKAFGAPMLSVQTGEYYPKIISPYSSFLMLERKDKTVLANLMIMEEMGLIGPYGFFESCEFGSNFLGDWTVVQSYMAHHKGMSMVALANAVKDEIFVKRFLSFADFDAKKELLAERFPLEGRVMRKKRSLQAPPLSAAPGETEILSMEDGGKNGKLLTDGKMSLVALDNGKNRILYQEMDLVDPKKGGISCRVKLGEIALDFNTIDPKGKLVRFGTDFVEYVIVRQKVSIVLRMQLLGGKNAMSLRLEVNGYNGPCQIEFSFDAMIQKEGEYQAHPAFQALALEGKSDGKNLVICRRGVEKHRYLHLVSKMPFKTSIQGKNGEGKFFTRMLHHPKVSISFSFGTAESLVLPIVLLPSDKESPTDIFSALDGSYFPSKDLQQKGLARILHLDEICFYDENVLSLEKQILPLLWKQRRILQVEHPAGETCDFLWKFGISGDFPMICVWLDENHRHSMDIADKLIRVQKKFHLAGLPIDLVILHKQSGGYFNQFREDLTGFVTKYHCEFVLGRHPGIHFAEVSSTKEIEQFALLSLETFGFPEFGETLLQEVAFSPEMNVKFPKENQVETVGQLQERGFLLEKNKFSPPVPFSHIVSNRMIGFVCDQNSLGFTWFRNSGLNRISKWESLPEDGTGEKVYLRMGEKVFDLISLAEAVEYRKHFAIYRGTILKEAYQVVVSASEFLSAKLFFVNLSSGLSEKGQLIFSFVPAMGKRDDRNILLSAKDDFVSFSSAILGEIGGFGWFCSRGETLDVTTSGERLNFAFSAREESTFFLGGASNEEHLRFLKRAVKNVTVEELLTREKEFSESLFPEKFSSTQSFWIHYQAVHSRFFGRTGLYQSSGAYGFRDQLQDSLVFLDCNQEITRQHLLRASSHQFEEGDVQHWWHPIKVGSGNPGIRTLCSDDYLWLLYVSAEYLEKTGDTGLLEIPAPFLKGKGLRFDEKESYFIPERGERGTFREHLNRCARLFLSRGLGPHNLPPILSGDWNDGMNLIDGESVWLGLFGAVCLHRCQKYLDPQIQEKLPSFFQDLSFGIRESFNGVWFVRAFREDGSVLGGDVSLESECSIDLITQAFSAFYYSEFENTPYALPEEMVTSALRAAREILSDDKCRTTALFSKPFVMTSPTPGYIQRYCAGVRENGGQYTHAAVWFALALLEFGMKSQNFKLVQAGKDVAKLLDPFANLRLEHFRRYQREPYVLCGDVYTADGMRGHGGWSWYTGAAGWYGRLLKELEKLENLNEEISSVE